MWSWGGRTGKKKAGFPREHSRWPALGSLGDACHMPYPRPAESGFWWTRESIFHRHPQVATYREVRSKGVSRRAGGGKGRKERSCFHNMLLKEFFFHFWPLCLLPSGPRKTQTNPNILKFPWRIKWLDFWLLSKICVNNLQIWWRVNRQYFGFPVAL